jgi:hypothetical protein
MLKTRGLNLSVIALSVAIIAPAMARAVEPAAAKTLLAGAVRAAKSKKKNVLVMFHATW